MTCSLAMHLSSQGAPIKSAFRKRGHHARGSAAHRAPALAKLVGANQELLRRYESLYAYPYYRESAETFFGLSDVLKIQTRDTALSHFS